MAKLILPSGRTFTYNDDVIIKYLEQAHTDIHDLRLLVHIQNLDTFTQHKVYQMKSSATLGAIGEAHIQDELTQLNIEWKNNSKIPHCGDIEFSLHGESVLLDVKNYESDVGTQEVQKLYNDCNKNNIRYALLVSLKSNISKKKTFSMEKSGDVTMLFLRVQNESDLKYAINTLSVIIHSDQHHTDQYINKDKLEKCVNNIDEQMRSITSMRMKCVEFHQSTEKFTKDMIESLNEHHKNIQNSLDELYDEIKVPSHNQCSDISTLEKEFEYFKDWKYIFDDLFQNGYSLHMTKNRKELHVYTESNIVAHLNFTKKKLTCVPSHGELKTQYIVENNIDWCALFTRIFN